MLVYASEELLTLKDFCDLREDESASIHPASLNKASPNRNMIQMRDILFAVLHSKSQRLSEAKTLLNWTVVMFDIPSVSRGDRELRSKIPFRNASILQWRSVREKSLPPELIRERMNSDIPGD